MVYRRVAQRVKIFFAEGGTAVEVRKPLPDPSFDIPYQDPIAKFGAGEVCYSKFQCYNTVGCLPNTLIGQQHGNIVLYVTHRCMQTRQRFWVLPLRIYRDVKSVTLRPSNGQLH